MLDVTFHEDGRQRPSSFVARGHADAGEHGEDVVCAAVSAVLQAARLGLQEHAALALRVEQQPGHLRVRWPEGSRDDAATCAIVATARLAVEQIARQYPTHVSVRIAPERD